MSARWFRVAYARNAFLRLLSDMGLSLDRLTPAQGVQTMIRFAGSYRPQHGVLDQLVCEWHGDDVASEFSIVRRLQREGHPEAPLRLTFQMDRPGTTSGSAPVTTLGEIRATPGYQAVRGAPVLSRTLV